jgi:hypothetical protein
LFLLAKHFCHPKTRIKRRESGSPILPIDCLFLSLSEMLLVYPGPSAYPRAETRKPKE